MTTKRVLVAVLGLILLACPAVVRADDEEDRARELLEALGGSTPIEPGVSDDEEVPNEDSADEEAEEAPRSFAEGGSLPGDLSELLEGYANEDGELTEEAAASATEEVQASASADTQEGQALRKALDRDGDGAVDTAEAQAGVEQAREARQEMRQQAGQLFFKHDADTDGQLSPQEFTAMVQELALPGSNTEAGVRAMFMRIDGDQDGMISAGEAQRAANTMAAAMTPEQRQRQRGQGQGRGEDQPGTGGLQLDPAVLALTQQTLQLDRNGDGMVGRREAAENVIVAANFDAADANGDNRLSGEEIYTYIKSMQGQ